MGKCDASVQRLMFWSCVLSGACGHTYGANGLWQMNRREQPHGNSPHGGNYGTVPWDDAMRLPGSAQLGLAKALLQRCRWWELEPHQEWVMPAAGPRPPYGIHCAGIPSRLRIVYATSAVWQAGVRVQVLEPGVRYQATAFDPADGAGTAMGCVVPDRNGLWQPLLAAEPKDWVLILEAEGARAGDRPV